MTLFSIDRSQKQTCAVCNPRDALLFAYKQPLKTANTAAYQDHYIGDQSNRVGSSTPSGSSFFANSAVTFDRPLPTVARSAQVATTLCVSKWSSLSTALTGSDAWGYSERMADINIAKANYGGLVLPYHVDPTKPIEVAIPTSSISYGPWQPFASAMCLQFECDGHLTPQYFTNNDATQSYFMQMTHAAGTSVYPADTLPVHVAVDPNPALVQQAFRNLQVNRNMRLLVAIAYTLTTASRPPIGFIDLNTGLAAIVPVFNANFAGSDYKCSLFGSLLASTFTLPFPNNGGWQLLWSMKFGYESMQQLFLSGTVAQMADAMRQDIQSINVSSSVVQQGIQFNISMPQAAFASPKVHAAYYGTATTTRDTCPSADPAGAQASWYSASSTWSGTQLITSSTQYAPVAMVSHVGLFDKDGLLLGYASMPRAMTVLYQSVSGSNDRTPRNPCLFGFGPLVSSVYSSSTCKPVTQLQLQLMI